MRIWIKAYAVTVLVMLVLDSAWLSLVGPRLYRPLLAPLLRPGFALGPALTFYAVYVVGILGLAVAPALPRRSGRTWGSRRGVAGRGALLGLVAYATYDLTNQATLRGWPLTITLADLAWGTLLTATSAWAGYTVARRPR